MRHRYFNHSATSYPKPASVGEAMAAAVNGPPLGVGRAAGEGPDDLLERLRMRLCRFVGGDAPERLIFAACATDALNTAILGLLGGISGPTAGEALPHVVCSDVDHNSMRRPLNALAAARRIELTRVPCDEQGFVDPDDIAAALKPHTALVTITHGSNVLGSVQDVPGIASRVRRDGEALILLDAAQTAGLLPLDVQAMEVDVVAFPGHKALLGPMGTGVLYVGDRAADRMQPMRQGGTGILSDEPTQPLVYPHRLEPGTPNAVGLAGLEAALDAAASEPGLAMGPRLAAERALREMVWQALAEDERFVCYGPADASRGLGVLSFTLRGYDPAEVATVLEQAFGMTVRAGLHCAPHVHERIGTAPAGSVRVSFGPGNTPEDAGALIDALRELAAEAAVMV